MYTVTQTGKDNGLIIVKTDGPEIENPKVGLTSSLIFTYRGGNITSGNLVEAIGDQSFIKTQGIRLASKFRDLEIPGFNKGAFILYDINHNVQGSHILVNGKSDNGTSAVIMQIPKALQKNLSALSGRKLSALNKFRDTLNSAKTAQTASTSTTVCTAYYLVTYDKKTGEILDQEYLYSTCFTYDTSGGGGGGSGGTGGPGIFGINNSNAQVSDANFDTLLAYVEANDMLFSDPENGTYIANNGITYTGQYTYIFDSTGLNLIAAYFSPDQSSNLFQLGYEYNLYGKGAGSTTIDDGAFHSTPYFSGKITLPPFPTTGHVSGSTGVTLLVEDPTMVDWSDEPDNEVLTDPNPITYSEYQQTDPWPTIANVIQFQQFVPFRYKVVNGQVVYQNGKPVGVNCLILAKQQLSKIGYTCSGYLPNDQTFQVYTTSVNTSQTSKAIGYIKSALSKGIPVIAGVDAYSFPASKNADGITDHFIVIDAMGTDGKGNYFHFIDSSTNDRSRGDNYDNKLYYDTTTGKISGKTASQYPYNIMGGHDYIVTQIRKSIKK